MFAAFVARLLLAGGTTLGQYAKKEHAVTSAICGTLSKFG